MKLEISRHIWMQPVSLPVPVPQAQVCLHDSRECRNAEKWHFYNPCRFGALSGHQKALMRASSQILTAQQDSESLAASPTRVNSQSTLDAKQMLPWTRDISVSFGDAALWTLNTRATQNLLYHLITISQTAYEHKPGLLFSTWRVSILTVS